MCRTFTTCKDKYHQHHYTDGGKWRLREVVELTKVTSSEAKPRPRSGKIPYCLHSSLPQGCCVGLHLPIGHRSLAHGLLLSLMPVCLGFWYVGSSHHQNPLGTQARLMPSASEGAPCQMPGFGVPGSTFHCQGQWAWPQTSLMKSLDGSLWGYKAGAAKRGKSVLGLVKSSGQLRTPLVSCLEDPSQCHVLQTHNASPHCGKEFRAKEGERGKSYSPADFLFFSNNQISFRSSRHTKKYHRLKIIRKRWQKLNRKVGLIKSD